MEEEEEEASEEMEEQPEKHEQKDHRSPMKQQLESNNSDGCQLVAKDQIITTTLPNVVSRAVEVTTATAVEMQMQETTNSGSNVVTTEATRLIQMMISSLTTTNATSTSITNNAETSSSNTSPIPKSKVAINSNTTTFYKTVVRKKEFSPPPPPPRRLMLTQTNLRSANAGSGPNTQQAAQQQSGASADSGFSADVVGNIHKRLTQINQKAVFNSKSCAANTAPVASQQPTIIETSLLGPATPPRAPAAVALHRKNASMLSSIASTTTKTTTTKAVKLGTTKTQQPDRSINDNTNKDDSKSTSAAHYPVAGLSPRLEMRLALNHDILGDEDLISYDPGPDLTTILGHDLTTFHRLTGRDLLTRTASNRVQPKEAVISFCQQRNSKMDTPTVNRRPRPMSIGGGADLIGVAAARNARDIQRSGSSSSAGATTVGSQQQHLHSNRNTLSNFAFAPASDVIQKVAGVKSGSVSSLKNAVDERKLSDLEILARREKMYSMSQSKNGSLVRKVTTVKKAIGLMRTRSTSSVVSAAGMMENDQQQLSALTMAIESSSSSSKRMGRDEIASMEAAKGNRLMNFLTRRNSELSTPINCSRTSLNESNPSCTPETKRRSKSKTHQQFSPRKDNDKPSLNRRLWKQITKRRRSNSVSELLAC